MALWMGFMSCISSVVIARSLRTPPRCAPGLGGDWVLPEKLLRISAAEDEEELDLAVVLCLRWPEARVGDAPVGEGHRDRTGDADAGAGALGLDRHGDRHGRPVE